MVGDDSCRSYCVVNEPDFEITPKLFSFVLIILFFVVVNFLLSSLILNKIKLASNFDSKFVLYLYLTKITFRLESKKHSQKVFEEKLLGKMLYTLEYLRESQKVSEHLRISIRNFEEQKRLKTICLNDMLR
ncbi:uncharacterized protein [Prorops nasuta]|uniref:uncharacterized protein n=1 Tax=Prorops nasuta TaxID=863751 RepID=UPI0034CE7C9E